MKKIIISLFALMLCAVLIIPAAADESYYVNDLADILSDSQEQLLEAKLSEISESVGADITVLSCDSINGLDPEDYCLNYLANSEYSADAMIFLVSMEYRDWCITPTGYCFGAINDEGMDYIADGISDYLTDGNYLGGFEAFADRCNKVMQTVRSGKEFKVPYSFGLSLIISIIIGFVLAFIVTGVMKSRLKTVSMKAGASDYVKSNSLSINTSRDIFLYRQVTRTVKPKNTSSSSGGSGGGGSRSGKF